jgi:dipeptidase E
MKNILLASTSTLFGEAYLAYLREEIQQLFKDTSQVVFIPYARPSGISHEEYTRIAAEFFKDLGKELIGLHEFDNPKEAITNAKGFLTGGGNTFLLVKQLHEQNLMELIKQQVEKGIPYLGTSAGSNIAGINVKNTNDMPIVYPPSFDAMSIIPFNINAHYLDPDPNSKHNGETRETRIKEFHVFNDIPVIGLREGSWIRVKGNVVKTEGKYTSRIFLPQQVPYELAVGSEIKF